MTSDHLRRVKRAWKRRSFAAESFDAQPIPWSMLEAVTEAQIILNIAWSRRLDWLMRRARFLRRYPYGSQAKGQPRRASGYIA